MQENNTHKWWVLIAVGIGTFMSALDGSVVNTILPVLKSAFSSSIASIEWVVTVYLLVLSGLLLSFGRLGDLRGHKNVYLLGFYYFHRQLSIMRPGPFGNSTGYLQSDSGLRRSHACRQFSGDPYQKLPGPPTWTGARASSDDDLSRAYGRSIIRRLARRPIQLAGCLLHQYPGRIGCNYSQLAIHSSGSTLRAD